VSTVSSSPIRQRVDDADWPVIGAELDEHGCALLPKLLTAGESAELIELYEQDKAFRSTVNMARFRFGSGEYRNLANPLPTVVDELRHALYPRLLPIARDWWTKLARPAPWPDDLDAWLTQCHIAGQARPTPLILRYGPGDWNAMHRDLYGELVFPLQVVIALTESGTEHTGGEFVLVEQRPRAQSRATVRDLPRGQGLIFTTRDRPVRSTRGWSAAPVRHGVSTVRTGRRFALGILFHDAT
jgi:hypothetical protein